MSSSSRDATPELSVNPLANDERKPIDKDQPQKTKVNLHGWLKIWQRLADSGNARDRDTFALTSHFTDPVSGERRRAQIDLEDYRPDEKAVIRQLSDIDSVIGVILGDIPVLPGTTVKYYILLSPSHTLTTNLHIPPVRVEQQDGSFKLGPDGLVRIYFPFLELPGGKVCMDEELMRELYDLVFRPAAVDILPEDLVMEWPPEYKDETFRGTIRKERTDQQGDQRGRKVQHSERDVHAEYLNPWMARAREIIAETPRVRWAKGLFLGFEMRGTKNQKKGMHPPPDDPLVDDEGNVDGAHPRVKAVEDMLSMFDTTQFEGDCWFLDIATRITISDDIEKPSACTFLDARMIPYIISHFTDLSWEDCLRYASGHGNHFQKDEVAHLNDISGGRLTNPNWAEDGVCFMQIYGTDKSVTYNLELAHNAQRTSSRRIIKSWDKEDSEHFTRLIEAFQNSSNAHGVALRIESRVEFLHYPNCHLNIPDDLLRRCLFRIPRNEFWGWKVSRLFSIRAVLKQWITLRSTFILDQLPEVGTLLLILEYMANALVNRPESGGHWDQVHDAACVHDMRDGQLVPLRPLGSLFLPTIHFDQNMQPRVSSQRCLPIHTICYLLGARDDPVTQMEAYFRITGANLKRRLEEDPRPWENTQPTVPRHSNKQRLVQLRSTQKPQDEFSHVMPTQERVRYASEEADPERREETDRQGKLLTQVVHNYPIQIIAKAPNRGGRHSWCNLQPSKRSKIQFDFFSSMGQLNEAFPSHTLFPCDASKWEKTLEILFPTVEVYNKTRDMQGVKTLGARHDFVELLLRMPEGRQNDLVAEVHAYISNHWVWLPFGAPKKHLWASGSNGLTAGTTQVGPLAGGPYIVLNPAFVD
ncbi:hypothetical protein FRC11_000304 [Ceratobasidium sp. 423]|nr:hypothetical protein FRC11_000304 [Ceratobasidium sp. 423]